VPWAASEARARRRDRHPEDLIRFLQEVLAQNPAIEVASDVPPFKFVQWDGKLLREIPAFVSAGRQARCRPVRHRPRRYGDPVLGCFEAPARRRP